MLGPNVALAQSCCVALSKVFPGDREVKYRVRFAA